MPVCLQFTGWDGLPWVPLGRPVIGGLIASSLLTLVVLPLFHVLPDQLREQAGRLFGFTLGQPGAHPATALSTGDGAAVAADRVEG